MTNRRRELSPRANIDKIEEIIRYVVLRARIRAAVMEAMWAKGLPLVEMT